MFWHFMFIYVSSVMQVYVGVSKNKKYAIRNDATQLLF